MPKNFLRKFREKKMTASLSESLRLNLPQSVRRFWSVVRRGQRNKFSLGEWTLEPLPLATPLDEFDCGNADLNEFFQKDAFEYERLLLAKTYILQREGYRIHSGNPPVALVSLCNDAIRTEKLNELVREPGVRYYQYMPAVKIARLGVHRDFQRSDVGTTILDMLKGFFLTENRTGCRIMTVDAYRDPPEVENFYATRGNFSRVPDSKRSEKQATVTMYYDLIRTTR